MKRRSVTIAPSALATMATWRIGQIRCALDAHEQGDFCESSQLATAVLRDAQCYTGLKRRTATFSSKEALPFSLEVAEGVDDRRAKSVRDRVDALWWTSCPGAQVESIHRDGVMLGVAVGRDDMPTVDGEQVPALRRLRPAGLRWVEHEGLFHYSDGQGVDHVVTPGENGWVLHAPHGPDSWLQGAIRPLGEIFLMRWLSLRDWARLCEKHGIPILAVKEPASANDDVEGEGGSEGADAEAFYVSLKRMSTEGVIRETQGPDKDTPGWEVRWLELQAHSAEMFEKIRRELRGEILSILTGKDADTANKGVGGDEAGDRERVGNEWLSADAEGMATTLRDHLWKPWVRRNIDAKKPELAPYPRWQTRRPADLAARSATLGKAADAIAKLEQLGVDTDAVLEEFHLKRKPGWSPLPKAPDTPLGPTKPPPIQA